MPSELSLAVVGAQHPNLRGPTRQFAIALCKPGDPVELRREPKNPADPHAVAVFNREGMQMGYLTAERAPWIGGMIGRGREMIAIFQSSTEHGAAIRLAFDGAVPVLPIMRDRPSADPDFWPDEEWPEY